MPRILFLIIILTVAGVAAHAQPAGYVEVFPIHSTLGGWNSCFYEGGVYTAAMLDAVKNKSEACRESAEHLQVDFATQTLISYGAQSDCHMRVNAKLFRVDAEKKYRLIINIIYGGCRAGGTRRGFMVVDRFAELYTLEMKDVRLERDETEFQFPKPPPTKTRELLNVREIDLDDCLPLTGQSQWVINDREILDEAIKRENRRGCRERFGGNTVDFERYTLLGLSFASGHCERPGDLRFEAVKETSSEPRESSYVFTAHYERPSLDTACKVWTTHTVWLLTPKMEMGYGITLFGRF